MIIDNKSLNEVTLKRVQVLAPDEHFYNVPNASKYILSTYGRLYKTTPEGGCARVKLLYVQGEDAYSINFDNSPAPEIISVRKLMRLVFFSDQPGIYLVNPKGTPSKYCWRIDDLHALNGKNEIIEYISSKIEHREATYSNDHKGNIFKNRADFNKPLRGTITRLYWDMYSRATNPKVKQIHKQYKDTTIDPELTLDAFIAWYIDNKYDYPGKLCIDKDILGFGLTNCYKVDLICLVPVYINNVFVEGTSKLGYCIREQARTSGEICYKIPGNVFTLDGQRQKDIICQTYIEALHAGRKRKADYIRAIVAKEKAAGYMPTHILDAMKKWAGLCEIGMVKMWEPSPKTLIEMGVVN